jgi:hypothetical protein
MSQLIELWRTSGTKILGFAQVTVAVLATSTGLFPDIALKWLMLLSGLLTAWRGYVNSAASR